MAQLPTVQEMWSHFQHWIMNLPHATRIILISLWVVYVFDTAFPSMRTCMPSTSLPSAWALTACVHHAGFLHIFMNSWAFVYQGKRLEDQFGSKGLLALVLGACVASEVTFWLLAHIVGVSECIVGFSGALFALLTFDYGRSHAVADIFGYHVPAKYVPWIIFVISTVLFPGATVMGHLAGIAVGYGFTFLETSVGWVQPRYPDPILPGGLVGGDSSFPQLVSAHPAPLVAFSGTGRTLSGRTVPPTAAAAPAPGSNHNTPPTRPQETAPGPHAL